MKKLVLSLALAVSLFGFRATAQSKQQSGINVAIDLNAVKDDKVMVVVTPSKINTPEITFHLPKTVPGTYSEDNYGKYIDNLKAYDAKGNALSVAKMDENSWTIKDAKKLAKVTYWVNDTYDSEVPSHSCVGSG